MVEVVNSGFLDVRLNVVEHFVFEAILHPERHLVDGQLWRGDRTVAVHRAGPLGEAEVSLPLPPNPFGSGGLPPRDPLCSGCKDPCDLCEAASGSSSG